MKIPIYKWHFFKVHTLANVFYNLPIEERERIEKLEMFDEYEEFILKCCHYFVLVATKVPWLLMDNIIPDYQGIYKTHWKINEN